VADAQLGDRVVKLFYKLRTATLTPCGTSYSPMCPGLIEYSRRRRLSRSRQSLCSLLQTTCPPLPGSRTHLYAPSVFVPRNDIEISMNVAATLLILFDDSFAMAMFCVGHHNDSCLLFTGVFVRFFFFIEATKFISVVCRVSIFVQLYPSLQISG
jgi:hypothetical protein